MTHGTGLERAEALLQEGDWRAALPLIDGHLQQHPADVHALYLLGIGRKMAGDLHGAENAFRQAIAGKPTHDKALYGLGLVLELGGKTQDAVEVWRAALALNPANQGAARKLQEYIQSAHAEPPVAVPPRFKPGPQLFAPSPPANARRPTVSPAALQSGGRRSAGCAYLLGGVIWLICAAIGVFAGAAVGQARLGADGGITGGVIGFVASQILFIVVSPLLRSR